MSNETTNNTPERIVLEIWNRRANRSQKVSFAGTWLVEPDPDGTRTAMPGWDAGAYHGVAMTTKGNIVAFVHHCNDRFPASIETYSSLAAMRGSRNWPEDIVAMAMAAVGIDEPVELDI